MFRALFVIALTTATAAATPVQLTHQARVLDAAGGALNVTTDVSVALYDDASAGTELWAGTFTNVRIDNGYVSLVLGSDDANPLDHSLLDGDRWVELTVGTVGTLAPRQPVGASPRAAIAIEAHHAQTADLAEEAQHAETADLAEEALHAETADSALTAELAAEADYATTAGTATQADTATTADYADTAGSAESAATASYADAAGQADTADTANFATTANQAGNASTVGGVSLAGLASPGTYNISYGSCSWTGCVDAPATATCPNGRVVTRVELPEFGGNQSTCGNEDDFRVYCCQIRITVPSAN